MDSEIRTLKALIKTWEKKSKDAARASKEALRMASRLRSALALQEKANPPEPAKVRRARKAQPPSPFTAKYAKALREYLLETIPFVGSGKAPTRSEIRDTLEARKLHYSDQAIAFELKRLEKIEKIRRRGAPNDSLAHYVYEKLRTEPEDRKAVVP